MEPKYALWKVDQKGRLQIPQTIREKAALYGDVAVEIKDDYIIIRPTTNVGNPLTFLTSINLKTKKTPVEMKREAEGGFLQ